jgi:hypothetical protein
MIEIFETNLTIGDWLLILICFALIWCKIESLSKQNQVNPKEEGR